MRFPHPVVGLIEGFYGMMWPDEHRLAVVDALGRLGYAFYHYAPKADPSVRNRWRQAWDEAAVATLTELGEHVKANGMRFGLGISPIGLQNGMDQVDRAALAARIEQMNAIGHDNLVVMFDDEAGSVDGLAEVQADIVHCAAERSHASRVFLCPTYYSDDPLLDELFGTRPNGYAQVIGRRLDPAVEIYWTGPKVVSETIPVDYIAAVAETLGRKPVLWDNYPVNDSPRMIRHLYLRAFTGRPAGLAEVTAGHAINPALQPHLSMIPAATLPMVYRQGDDYDPDAAFGKAARACVGDELAGSLHQDLAQLHDRGLGDLDGDERSGLRACYAAFDHPAANEVVRWLDGTYRAFEDLATTDE
ncbi:MAG: beta-N-acetylglucosaminidase domain-containing protein [Xanthomonadales bacterium]|nr:beta-N-acetylglucosaminidase domain-containing protein [Xanthomonadales bacterium]